MAEEWSQRDLSPRAADVEFRALTTRSHCSPLKLIKFSFVKIGSMFPFIIFLCIIPRLSTFSGLLVSRLQQSIKQLKNENEEQNKALEEARIEVKELREFMKSVSIMDTRLVKRYIHVRCNQLLTKNLHSCINSGFDPFFDSL